MRFALRRTARSFVLSLLGATALFGVLAGCSAILGFDKSVEEQRSQRPDGETPLDDGGSTTSPPPSGTDGGTPVFEELRGELDPTFGNDGSGYVVTSTDISGVGPFQQNNTCRAALDGKGRIVVACAALESEIAQAMIRTRVLRFDAKGGLDPSFGHADGGVAVPSKYVPYLAVQSDDRVLLAGFRFADPDSGSSQTRIWRVLERLQDDGTLDTSVGDAGNMLPNADGRWSYAGATQLASGKAIVMGEAYYEHDDGTFTFTRGPYRAVVDLASGKVDSLSEHEGVNVSFEPLSITAIDGSTVQVFGRYGDGAFEIGVSTPIVGLARFVDGKLDPSYGDGGIETVQASPQGLASGSAWTESSGDVAVVAGGFGHPSRTSFFRFRADGGLDTTIGDAGAQLVPAPSTAPDAFLRVTSLVPTKKEKMLTAGALVLPTSKSHAFLVRLRPDGSVDPTFGDKGYVDLVVGIGKNELVDAILPQPDGRVLAVGRALNEQGNWDVFVARYR